MKHLALFSIYAMLFLAACNGKKGDGKLSTDLVTNPMSATKPSETKPVITFDKMEHDFGNLLQGEVVTYSFRFTNTGNAPLIISSVSTSCGCTAGDFSREPVEPGKEGFVKASYNSKGHKGFQNKSLTVITNTNPSKTVLRLKGKVIPPDQY